MILFAMFSAQETAKAQKTRALVAKLDTIIKAKWEAYKTRRVPVTIPPDTDSIEAARIRLDGLHDLMRMELPDRYTDVVQVDPNDHQVTTTPSQVTLLGSWPYSANPIAPPAAFHSYLRRIVTAKTAMDKPSIDYQSAEMLYLIVTASLAGDEDSRGVFKADNISDVDGDGMSEFVDGWGNPIKFLRWPAGFPSELSIVARGTATKVDFVLPLPIKTVVVKFDRLNVPPGGIPNLEFSEARGAYIGGSLVQLAHRGAHAQANDHNLLDAQNFVARITGYDFRIDPITNSPTAMFTCTVPLNTNQRPFGTTAGGPWEGDDFLVLAPDPFDPQGVYPLYPDGAETWPPGVPDWSLRTWALYPLIYSAGSDGDYDILDDTPPTLLRYVDEGLSPYYVNTLQSPSYQRMGMPGRSRFSWTDNIHNHMQGLR